MPDKPVMLDREKLETLFTALDNELDRLNATAEIYVAGGARMVLGLRDTRTTTDIDVAFRRRQGPVDEAIGAVTQEHGLKPGWINEGMATSLPTGKDPGETALYEGKRLKVIGASAERMLAMKVMALRDKDLDDIETLMDATGLRRVDEIKTLIKKEYANEGPGADALAKVRLPTFEKWLARRSSVRDDEAGNRKGQVHRVAIGDEPPGPKPGPKPAAGASEQNAERPKPAEYER